MKNLSRIAILLLFISLLSYTGARASSAAVSPEIAWKPYLQQLTSTSVLVTWTTRAGRSAEVRYSADTTYGAVATGGSRPIGALGTQMHQVKLDGLRPATTYNYKVFADGEELLPGESLSFRTAPPSGSAAPFTFVAFGDYGLDVQSQRDLRDQMLKDSFDFILTTGDNAYYTGAYAEFDAKVFKIYADIFSRAAVFPGLGNHDVVTENGAPYLDLFDPPRAARRSETQERYYSFDYGNAHFAVLDSNRLDAEDSAAADMYAWLRDDLSRTTRLWKIVVLHYPPYSTGSHGSNMRAREKLTPIFEQTGVQLVLAGHDHTYQRSQPLVGEAAAGQDESGIVYVVTGAGSAASYGCTGASWLVVSICSEPFGLYSRVTVGGDCLLIEAIDAQGRARDRYDMCQPPRNARYQLRLPLLGKR